MDLHFHLLYGSTDRLKPEHREILHNFDLARARFEELHMAYANEHPDTLFSREEEGAELHNECIKHGHVTNVSFDKDTVYGDEFVPDYMLIFYACESANCVALFN